MGTPENVINLTLPDDQRWENLKIAKDSKIVRLDVYIRAEKNMVYNVEIQTSSNRDLPKRTRYYSGMIDLNAIEKGADYSELPKSLVIFICTFDAFGDGEWRYTFENICREKPKLRLNDGTYKIFFNTKGINGNISEDTKNILRFIEDNTAEDDFTKKLAQEVRKIKENKEWQVEYMTLLMREREKYKEGMADGEIIGEIRGVIKTCKNFDSSFQETVQYIIDNFNLSFQEAEEAVKKNW